MNRTTWRLILIVSCAHALVHIFELALPSVELNIAGFYGVGKETTGLLSTYWRLPWGLGALGAGWLVDRFGSERMLAIYLIGCGVMCCLVAAAFPLPIMFVIMFTMGTFASIYHPAGLALISHATTLESRPRALGIHGIFGSAGIGTAPFLAALLLTIGFSWRQYYLVLAVAGLALGAVFVWRSFREVRHDQMAVSADQQAEQDSVDWGSFAMLVGLALMQGFIYSAVLSFLPRFLGDWQFTDAPLTRTTRGAYLTGAVLLVGCFGQYTAGRIARANLLEGQLAGVSFCNVPFLLAMAFTQGGMRVAAAGMFAFTHFMHQPLYNSLIAKYTPRRRRSISYGLSFAIGAGLGSFGAAFNGYSRSDVATYSVLACVAIGAGCMGLLLAWRNRQAAPAR